MKRLNMKKLKELSPCIEGYEFVLKLKTTDLKTIFEALFDHDAEWANWLIARLLSRKDKIRYAIFAAEQVLDIFEKEFPEDKRPREAIEAARTVLKNNNKKNRVSAARSAESAARSAARSAYSAAYSAAESVAYSVAYSAEAAAYSVAYSAEAAAYSAAASAESAAEAAAESAVSAARTAMKIKIVKYGLSLLRVELLEKEPNQ